MVGPACQGTRTQNMEVSSRGRENSSSLPNEWKRTWLWFKIMTWAAPESFSRTCELFCSKLRDLPWEKKHTLCSCKMDDSWKWLQIKVCLKNTLYDKWVIQDKQTVWGSFLCFRMTEIIKRKLQNKMDIRFFSPHIQGATPFHRWTESPFFIQPVIPQKTAISKTIRSVTQLRLNHQSQVFLQITHCVSRQHLSHQI